MPGLLHDHFGEGPLRRRKTAEGVVLVHLAEFGGERLGRDAVADFPASAVIGLAEAGNHEAAFSQFRIAQGAFMTDAAEHDVFVNLVGQHQDIGVAGQGDQTLHVLGRPQDAGGIMRGVDEYHPGLCGDCRLKPLPVHRKIDRIQRHMHAHASGQIDGRFVAVVAWIEHDDFIPRTDHGQDGVENRFRGAAGHGDFQLRTGGMAVTGGGLGGNGLAQGRNAGHRRILVLAVTHGAAQSIHQKLGHRKVGKSLAQIDRLMLHGHLRHDREDGGADLRELGLQRHGRDPV